MENEEDLFVEIQEWAWEMTPGEIRGDGKGNWEQQTTSFWGWYDEVHGATMESTMRSMTETAITKVGLDHTIVLYEKTYTKEGAIIKKLATLQIHG